MKKLVLIVMLLAVSLSASPVWAVQAHGGDEGLLSHQLGHLLFIFGMGYLLFRLDQFSVQGAGWLEFKLFLVTITAWNFLTFVGHWLNESVAPEKFSKFNGHNITFTISTWTDAFYYLSRLDHLLLVPALVLLVLALRKWRLA